LFGGNRLYVRATPYSESAVDGVFNITAIEEVIQPLRKACGW
jgi:type VI secretion system protein VasI